MSDREAMEFDLVVVGAGPAGLAAAIRAKQLAPDCAVCVVEKGGEVGAHTLSGAVIEPRGLDELLPDWREMSPPEFTVAGDDEEFHFFTAKGGFKFPLVPRQMHNHGNLIGSLGNLVRWLGAQAEALGVEIYPGFPAAGLIEEEGQIKGVITGDLGVEKSGAHGPNYQPGMELRASYTIFAEGCRGSLSKQLIKRFALDAGRDPQTYGLGVKELWEIPADRHRPGFILHSVGWPMDSATYGGSFLYHWGERYVSYGFVVGLDYRNPDISPFEEMQRAKTHPVLRSHFEGGKRISYGARAIVEGGLQSLPKLAFPGGVLIGDAAGFLNVPKIKVTHTAIKSGMLAAEALIPALAGARPPVVEGYETAFRQSWLAEELAASRNIRPGFSHFGLWGGLANAALDTYVFRGRAPWTLHHHRPDNATLRAAKEVPRIVYPKPDGVLTFDRLSSVYISNTNHEENQPVHLKLRDPSAWLGVNFETYGSPESRYCPAGVYEVAGLEQGKPSLQINAQNCVHCKTCDIKDPGQNIDWCTPEGGGGPNYPGGM